MSSNSPMRRTIFQFLTLFGSLLLTVAVIYADVLVLGSTMGERSLVEVLQALMILGSAAFFAAGASNSSDQRGYLILVSTLFLCMFVRENDGLLDNVEHGFWRIPVLIIAVVGMFAVVNKKKTIRSPFIRHAQDASFWILAVGFLQLIVFSRLFGSGSLWHNIPGHADLGPTKTIIQESIELMSYSLILLGSFFSYRYSFGAHQTSVTKKAVDDDRIEHTEQTS